MAKLVKISAYMVYDVHVHTINKRMRLSLLVVNIHVRVCLLEDVHFIERDTTKKIFLDRHFSYIVHVVTLRAQKTHSATSSEGSWLVRIVVPCAQKRVHGHRDAFLSEQCKAPRVSRGLLSRPPSLEQSNRRGCHSLITHTCCSINGLT